MLSVVPVMQEFQSWFAGTVARSAGVFTQTPDDPNSPSFGGSVFLSLGNKALGKAQVRGTTFRKDPSKYDTFHRNYAERAKMFAKIHKNRENLLKRNRFVEDSPFGNGHVSKITCYNHYTKFTGQQYLGKAIKGVYPGGNVKGARKLQGAMADCDNRYDSALLDPSQRKLFTTGRVEVSVFFWVDTNFLDSTRKFASDHGLTINITDGVIEPGGITLMVLRMTAEAVKAAAEAGVGPSTLVDPEVFVESCKCIREAADNGGVFTGDDKRKALPGAYSAAVTFGREAGWSALSIPWCTNVLRDPYANRDPLSGKVCFHRAPSAPFTLACLPELTAAEGQLLREYQDEFRHAAGCKTSADLTEHLYRRASSRKPTSTCCPNPVF